MGRKLDVNSGWSVNLVTALIGFYVIEPDLWRSEGWSAH